MLKLFYIPTSNRGHYQWLIHELLGLDCTTYRKADMPKGMTKVENIIWKYYLLLPKPNFSSSYLRSASCGPNWNWMIFSAFSRNLLLLGRQNCHWRFFFKTSFKSWKNDRNQGGWKNNWILLKRSRKCCCIQIISRNSLFIFTIKLIWQIKSNQS